VNPHTTALSEGLGFAEIARRLGRPTSTITREVARNGGREAYRWDRAHQATRRRARRSKPAWARELPDALDRYGRDAEAVRGFVERFATMLARTGLPRMTARVLIRLFTSDSRSLTAAELVLRLRVSPASISKAIGHLERAQAGFPGRCREGRGEDSGPGDARRRQDARDGALLRAALR
jgi:DNA-binding MarR family transcriptional regulator